MFPDSIQQYFIGAVLDILSDWATMIFIGAADCKVSKLHFSRDESQL